MSMIQESSGQFGVHEINRYTVLIVNSTLRNQPGMKQLFSFLTKCFMRESSGKGMHHSHEDLLQGEMDITGTYDHETWSDIELYKFSLGQVR